MPTTNLIFSHTPGVELEAEIRRLAPSSLFILADDNTLPLVVKRLIENAPSLAGAKVITTPAGDMNKSLEAMAEIWRQLSDGGATRHSLLINVGGGMVTDMGGFAAATFKRGMRFINVATTLLGAVDAALGGKTGINFNGLKNEIGSFAQAEAVIVDTNFFATLPHPELLSGYAELLKHSLLESDDSLNDALLFDISHPDFNRLAELLRRSVEVKQRITLEDPFEQGLRKALNLGHTTGHAIESHAMEKGHPIPHGHAVATGLVTALVISHLQLGLDNMWLHRMADYITTHYPAPSFSCADYPRMVELMHHDKKNTDSDTVRFTLLKSPGSPMMNCAVEEQDITAALDITRDLLHI